MVRQRRIQSAALRGTVGRTFVIALYCSSVYKLY